MSTAETLDEEDRGRRWAAPAAALGGALPLGTFALQISGQKDVPHNQLGSIIYLDEHPGILIAGSILQALGIIGTVFALLYLFRATRARRPEVPRVALPLLVAGGAVLVIATVASQILFVTQAGKFVSHGGLTYQEFRDSFRSGALAAAQIAPALASAIFGAAIVVVALNAMRVGLLTRFMGYLGIFAGGLMVFSLLAAGAASSAVPGSGILQPFWLIALAVLFARRWPQGMPPAWTTGKAEPWPTAQEMREQREAARGGEAPRRSAAAPAPVPQGAADGPARPGAARRKRKTRR
jgi:uncharacterized membrane protein